ncbi:3-hydroxybutyrate oligomer hydrolase family protein [Paracoccus beibuensis]|uniref:3-hydroxybutyrate oligomer hydrolase family protein n=1 Tax=Paracoccus beibuensis TaxID=547602 RepID=UPI00223FF8E8|nr:3-hydroxybutyrate oligomer hydrolase family protein [Paracoccus beibuensis]
MPIEPYHIDALELMHRHLTQGDDLPPSQLIHAAVGAEGEGRGGTRLILPEIAAEPDTADLVTVDGGHVTVPH